MSEMTLSYCESIRKACRRIEWAMAKGDKDPNGAWDAELQRLDNEIWDMTELFTEVKAEEGAMNGFQLQRRLVGHLMNEVREAEDIIYALHLTTRKLPCDCKWCARHRARDDDDEG